MNYKILIASIFALFMFNKPIYCQDNKGKYYELQSILKRHYEYCGWRRDTTHLNDSNKIMLALNYVNDSINVHGFVMMSELKSNHNEPYKTINDSIKIRHYLSFLQGCHYANGWGFLTLEEQKDRFFGKEIISFGKKSLPYLKKLINNSTSMTYGGGSEGNWTYGIYRHRIKDFAYRYAAIILGEKPIFLKTREERDKVIEAFIKKYPEHFDNN